jgi:hypothetical protein
MIAWPEDRAFAFTVFDDTDSSMISNSKPVYDMLERLGFRTTKSCWVRVAAANEDPTNDGSTIEDPEYRDWLLRLKASGFEIALHNTSSASSTRDQTIRGIEKFIEIFGSRQFTFANHTNTRDSVYWASNRLTGPPKVIYRLLTRQHNDRKYVGHHRESDYYWGDLLKKHVKYIRNFTFNEVNTLRVCPEMPYYNPETPEANMWFASCDGHDFRRFCDVLSRKSIDRLVAEGGLCIMYTHFAHGFVRQDGSLEPRFIETMEYIAQKNGWFATLSEVLDYLLAKNGVKAISKQEHDRLSWKWLLQKIGNGGSS